MRLTVIFTVITFCAGILWAQTEGFARYQVILDKNMFGKPQPTPRPIVKAVATPPPASPGWAREFRVTMMVKDEKTGEVKVGLQNLKDSSGKYLRIGDNPDYNGGYELLRADFDQKIAIIAYQGTQHQFTQEAGPATVAEPKADVRSRPGHTTARARTPVRSPRAMPTRRPIPKPRPQPKYQGAELDAHLQRYNEQVIRQGLPALPIPLTPEQDARLVRDGILEPQ